MYLQAAQDLSPLHSAVDILPTSLVIAPFALLSGIVVTVINTYREVNWVGWVITMIGFGLLSMLKEDSSLGKYVGFQIVAAAGAGLIVSISRVELRNQFTTMPSSLRQFSRYWHHYQCLAMRLPWRCSLFPGHLHRCVFFGQMSKSGCDVRRLGGSRLRVPSYRIS